MSEFKVEYSLTDADGEYVYEEMIGFLETTLKEVVTTAKESIAKAYGIGTESITLHAIYEKVISYDED